MQLLTFMTYNQALMWDRFERMFVICAAVLVIAIFEIMVGSETYLLTSVTTIIAQFLVLKCWVDMIMLSRPHENCWAFKE